MNGRTLTRFSDKAITIVMALLFSTLVYSAEPQPAGEAEADPETSLRFALSDTHGFPKDDATESFDCLDKIYAITELTHFEKGKHQVEFRWLEPRGTTRERTVYDFWVRDKPSTKLWAWLELSRAKGAGMLQWLNPAAGLEEFLGSWEVRLFIDGKEYNSAGFEVSC